jgi:hypothetical protein
MYTKVYLKPSVQKIVTWYQKYERLISSFGLIGGFVFDAIYLKRIDFFWENFFVIVHIVWAGTALLALNFIENNRIRSRLSDVARARLHFWLIILVQAAFGGLLSVYLVFYFRSASLATSWPFFLILVLAFASNEILKHHYTRLVFQISIFYLSLYSFSIFVVPLFVHRIGDDVFLLSGFISLMWPLLVFWLYFGLLPANGFIKVNICSSWL